MELTIRMLILIILLIIVFSIILFLLIFFFKQGSFRLTAKEFCLLTIGKLFGKAELCEIFIV